MRTEKTGEERQESAVSPVERPINRWLIAIAGVCMQIAFGAVYAWSVFRAPLVRQFGWSISQVTLTFTIAIFALGFAAFFGGLWMSRKGPKSVALTGGALYGLGVFLASFSDHGLVWLYLSYGLIGGIGLGLGYIVPVAVLVKWFPDRRGLINGVAVGGFGVGALVTAPLAIHLIQTSGVMSTFRYLGIAYAILTVTAGSFMRNPPSGWTPAGWKPKAPEVIQRVKNDYSLAGALRTWQWWALWLLLFINVSAGISIISQEAPMFQELTRISALQAAGMVGIVSIGNALGRLWWAWLSDFLSRRMTFVTMFVLQAALFWLYPELHSVIGVGAVTFVVFDVLRRRIRDDAGFLRGLFRAEEHRIDLRADAHSVEFRQRHRTPADRSHAGNKPQLRGSPAFDFRGARRICSSSPDRQSARSDLHKSRRRINDEVTVYERFSSR